MIRSVLAVAALAVAGSAQASIILFSDDFEAEAPRLAETASLANWTVTGNVDVVGMPNTFGITCDGTCVDLDGTTGPGRIETGAIAFASGQPVRVTFDLSGSQRSSNGDFYEFLLLFTDDIDISGWQRDLPVLGAGSFGASAGVGGFVDGGLVAGSRPFGSYFLEFQPLQAGSLTISFSTTSADNIGPLIDNVLVTQVPEPATWAMLIAGFGLVGLAARRRARLAA